MRKQTNKKKSLLWVSAFLCAACASGAMIVTAANGEPTVSFSDSGLLESYVTNAKFESPTVSATIDGKTYETERTVVFPDGTTRDASSFVLDQAGEYTIVYTVVVDGKTYSTSESFEVKDTSSGLITVENGKVRYATETFGRGEVSGAIIDAEMSTKVTYNKVINLAESTSNDLLIEIASMSNTTASQSEDFSAMYVTLTDIYDETNTITMKIYSARANHWGCSYIQGKAYNQQNVGLENGGPNFGFAAGGYVIDHSFGYFYGGIGSTAKLYYNAAEKAMYAKRGDLIQPAVDFDDESYQSKPWKGWTTGEVTLSVTIGDVTGKPRFVIKSIDGNELASEYSVDQREPVVVCDIPDEVPYATVGKKYPVFGAKAWDNGALKEFTTRVFYRYGTGNETNVGIVGGAFTPRKAGIYTIIYKAVDTFGLETVKTVNVEAKDPADLDELTLTLESNETQTVQVGELITLRDYSFTGGVGFENITVTLEKDGAVLETLATDRLFIYETGEYQLKYTLKDYVGNESAQSYNLVVLENTKPLILNEIVLPVAFASGLSYTLPQIQAYDYSSGSEKKIAPVITATMNGQALEVTNGAIKPVSTAADDKVTVTYKYENAKGGVTEWTKEVPVVAVKAQDGAIKQNQYFYGEGFTTKTMSDAIEFTTTVSGAETAFIRPVQARNFSLAIALSNEAFACDYVDVNLADRTYVTEKLSLRIYKNGKISVNGGDAVAVSAAKDETKTTFTINYDNSALAFTDSGNNAFAKVKTNAFGEAFDGFTSNEVFVSIVAGKVTGETKIYLVKLNNQTLSSSGRDNIIPQIYINDLLGGSKNLGEIFTVYKVEAYDVLSDIVSVTLTVQNKDTGDVMKDVNGKALKDVDASVEYQVKADFYGRYQVTYVAKDSAGKSFKATKMVNVFDSEPPKVTVSGKVPQTGKVGETITMPVHTATDAQTDIKATYFTAVAPNGETIYFESSFTPDQAGVWYVRYLALDENYQITMIEYKITVA